MIYSIHNSTNDSLECMYKKDNLKIIYRIVIPAKEKQTIFSTSKKKNERDCEKGNPLSSIELVSIKNLTTNTSPSFNNQLNHCDQWVHERVKRYMTYTLKLKNKDFE